MEAKDRAECAPDNNSICRLEWIAWAMEAARRHKDTEQRSSGSRLSEKTIPLDDDED
jgi:hypothetical protein